MFGSQNLLGQIDKRKKAVTVTIPVVHLLSGCFDTEFITLGFDFVGFDFDVVDVCALIGGSPQLTDDLVNL